MASSSMFAVHRCAAGAAPAWPAPARESRLCARATSRVASPHARSAYAERDGACRDLRAGVIRAPNARVRIDAVFRARPLMRQGDLRDLADEDLMALVRDGQARAFEVVFARHSGPAFSLAYRMCGRRGLAEEVVQEAFISLWRSGARYDRTRGSVRSWVLGVVHNRAIDALRRQVARASRDVADEGIAERLPAPELTDVET